MSHIDAAFAATEEIARFLEATCTGLDTRARPAFLTDDADAESARLVAEALPGVRTFLDESYAHLTRLDASLDPAERARVARHHRLRVQPLFLGSRFVRWSIDKPFGYPGDFRIVEMLFDNRPDGPSPSAQLLSTYTLDCGPTRAHRARLPWVHDHLRRAGGSEPLEILSYACGPERVMRAWFAGGGDARLTLCDFDPRALDFARKELGKVFRARGTNPPVRTITASAFDLIREPASAQQLKSSRPDGLYDVVMVLGLLDYLNDAETTAFLDALTTVLAPGGLCLLTNLHAPNPWRSFMDYVGYWTVIHREREAFGRLAMGNGRLREVELTTDSVSGTNVFFAGRR